jgi:hypothetical protein
MFGAILRRSRDGRRFATRSTTRDLERDRARIGSLFHAIEEAITSAEAEYSGLKIRIGDVLARSAITLGNGIDEYLTREPADTKLQNEFGQQIANGQSRLSDLEQQMKAFKFLKAALLTRFPDFPAKTRDN